MALVLGAIDIGSNGMRMTVARCESGGSIEPIETSREPIRLGQDVFSEGTLKRTTIAKGVAAIAKFKKVLKTNNAVEVRAVATSALREASNSAEFIARVKRVTGIQIRIIPGAEEARLVHLAVSNVLNLSRSTTLLIDIGGGSVETTLIVRGDVALSESAPMGTVRLLQIMGDKPRSPRVFYRLVREYASALRRQVKRELLKHPVTQCVGTGGNIESFGDLRMSLLAKDHGRFVTDKELEVMLEIIGGMSLKARIEKLKLRPDRADVIVPAGIVIQAAMREAGLKKILIPRVGLREGVLLDLMQERSDEGKDLSFEQQRRRILTFALGIGRRFAFDEKHAKHVKALCEIIFDATHGLHKAGLPTRLLLEVAALLHDIGHFVNNEDHQKHSYYLIREMPFVGLTDSQRELVAAIARYHRGDAPSNKSAAIQDLAPDERSLVRQMSAILRLAEALDKEHESRVTSVEISRRGKKVKMRLIGRGAKLIERWALEDGKDPFEKVFGVELLFT